MVANDDDFSSMTGDLESVAAESVDDVAFTLSLVSKMRTHFGFRVISLLNRFGF